MRIILNAANLVLGPRFVLRNIINCLTGADFPNFNVTILLIPYASYTVANSEDINDNVQCSSVLREIWASIRVTLSRFRIE